MPPSTLKAAAAADPTPKAKVAKLKKAGKPAEMLARIPDGPKKHTLVRAKKALDALHLVRDDSETLDEMLARLGVQR